MTRWIPVLGWLASMAACAPVNPCDEYVDYMCACHADDIDCNELGLTYGDVAPSVQDECAVLLDEAEEADQAAGEACG